MAAIQSIIVTFVLLTFGTLGTSGVGVSNLVNPLFRRPSSSSVPPTASLDLNLPVPVATISPNATTNPGLQDGKAGSLIGTGPCCWGGLDVLGLLSLNLQCLSDDGGCADVIYIIWKLFTIFEEVGSLETLSFYLKTVVIPNSVLSGTTCDILNGDTTIHSQCQVYKREEVEQDDKDDAMSMSTSLANGKASTYNLNSIAGYIDVHSKCLHTCLTTSGYILPTVGGGLRGLLGLTPDQCDDIRDRVCPDCICNVINLDVGGALGGILS